MEIFVRGVIIMNNQKNDDKILELKKQIAEKKKSLNKVARFAPITNCSIELRGERSNINVLSKDNLIMLMIELNEYILSAKDLGLTDSIIISGYTVEDWITDIKAKLEVMSYKEEENKLKLMESKLDKLLSNEKKTELEIDEIANLLG
jgi:hypothetical protein